MNMFKTVLPAGVIASVLALSLANQAQATNTFGIDVSSYQGSPNWTTVKANGAIFAYVKATEGNYYEDPDFSSDMVNGKAAGVLMGAYDFCLPDSYCPSVEAAYFWSFAGSKIAKDGKSIMPMLDFETYSGVTCGEGTYTAWINDWQTDLRTHTSTTLRCIVYTSACAGACDLIEYNSAGGIALGGFIADYDGENLYTGNPWGSCDCCNAWVTGCGTGGWTYWQVSSTGSIGGISGSVDFDAYNGTAADLKSWQGVQ